MERASFFLFFSSRVSVGCFFSSSSLTAPLFITPLFSLRPSEDLSPFSTARDRPQRRVFSRLLLPSNGQSLQLPPSPREGRKKDKVESFSFVLLSLLSSCMPSLPRRRPAPRFLAVGAPLLILVGSGFAGLQHLLSGKLEIKVSWLVEEGGKERDDC